MAANQSTLFGDLLAATQLVRERPQRVVDVGQESPEEIDHPREGL